VAGERERTVADLARERATFQRVLLTAGWNRMTQKMRGFGGGLDGSVGRNVGSAQDWVVEVLPDCLADHLLEKNLDCPGQRP
jgi:hypothetical protein